jgi:hypothetical protein
LILFRRPLRLPSGLLYEIYDADMNIVAKITIGSLVADFEAEQAPA